MTTFYENLQFLCYTRGITPSKLCIDLGIDKSNATNWKHGMKPRYDKLVAISEYFGIDKDELMNKELISYGTLLECVASMDDASAQQDSVLSITEEEQRLISAWRCADENEKSAIAALFGKYGFKRTEEKRIQVKVG